MPQRFPPRRWTEVCLCEFKHTLQLPFNAIDTFIKLRSTIRAKLEKDGPLPPEVLTPPHSRDASPMRLRDHSNDSRSARHKSKSPGRWRVIRAVSKATRSVVESVRPDVYGKAWNEICRYPTGLINAAISYNAPGLQAWPIHSSLGFQSFPDHWSPPFCRRGCT